MRDTFIVLYGGRAVEVLIDAARTFEQVPVDYDVSMRDVEEGYKVHPHSTVTYEPIDDDIVVRKGVYSAYEAQVIGFKAAMERICDYLTPDI